MAKEMAAFADQSVTCFRLIESPSAMSILPTTLSEADVAALLGMAVKTLRNWRVEGKGPIYTKPSRVVVYLPDDVTAYLNACRRAPDGAPVPPPCPGQRSRSRPDSGQARSRSAQRQLHQVVMFPVRWPIEHRRHWAGNDVPRRLEPESGHPLRK